MPCPTLISPACAIGKDVASSVASGTMEEIAKSIREGIQWVVTNPLTWWVRAGSPDLTGEPAVDRLQSWMVPITVAVAMLSLIAAGGRLAITRKAAPLVDVGSGLLIIAATAAIGVALPALLLRAGDAWSTWVLNQATDDVEKRLSQLLMLEGAAPGVTVVLGIIAMVVAAAQALLMVFRQAAILVLAGLLPLAATGTLAPATKGWFRKVTAWMLALIFYKPAAAAVYATAFTMIGTGEDPRTMFMGFAMVVLSIVAFPALLKFFTWTTGSTATSEGNGFLGAVMGGAAAVGAMRGIGGGGNGPVQHAQYMNSGPGGPNPPNPPPAGGPSGPGPQPPSGPSGGGAAGGGRPPEPATVSGSGAGSSATGGGSPSGGGSAGTPSADGGSGPPRSGGTSPPGAATPASGSPGLPETADGGTRVGAGVGAAAAVAGAVAAVQSVREGAERAAGAREAPSGPGYDVRLPDGAPPPPPKREG